MADEENRALRIAFVNPQGNFDVEGSHLAAHPDFGGQLVYVREVALALAGMGHRADILTRRIADDRWPEFAAAEESFPGCPNVRILRFPCGPERFLPKEELWPHLGEWVENAARHYRREVAWPDLWTGHYADGGLAAALLEESSNVPFTFTAHSLGAWKLDRLLQKDAGRLGVEDSRYNFGARISAEKAAISRAAAIIANSDSERRGQYRHPAYREVVDAERDERFAVIPPGVNLSVFGAEGGGPREEEVRGRISAALERDIVPERRGLPAVIAWSRLDPAKNHMALVRAFARRPELCRRANLLMITRGVDDPLREPEAASAGEREVLRPLVDEIRNSGMWGCVSAFSLAGQDAVAALYRWGASVGGVFCLPAYYEPFGMSVVEAMSAGLPVVATANGGPREITAEGRAGLLADPDDPEDFADRLLYLLTDPKAWCHYAAKGRERARERFVWRRAAEGYADLAYEVIRGERAGDASFPLPAFARRAGPLPRLKSWGCSPESARPPGAAMFGADGATV